jgi:asparagine synthase (glutamine-hydrolysing)
LDPGQELKLKSDQDYDEAYCSLLTEAVRCRLSSAFPVGSELSGGLDSSSIACIARNLLLEAGGQKLNTFSFIFNSLPECDERDYIAEVVDRGDIHSYFVPADEISPFADFERLLWHQDEPFWVPNLFMFWGGLYRSAHRHGIRVMLSGEDGDTVVSHGKERLVELARQHQFWALFREIHQINAPVHQPTFGPFYRHVVGYGIPSSLRDWAHRMKRMGSPMGQSDTETRLASPLIRREFAESVHLEERFRFFNRPEPSDIPFSRACHWNALSSGLHPYILEVSDRATAPFGIEPRYPFYDRRLVEFCLSLPPEQKLGQGWTRLIARRSLKGILPEKIRSRRGKAILSSNFIRSLLLHECERLEDVVMHPSDALLRYVDINVLRNAYRRYSHFEQQDDSDALTVWKAVSLAAWLDSQQSAVYETQKGGEIYA